MVMNKESLISQKNILLTLQSQCKSIIDKDIELKNRAIMNGDMYIPSFDIDVVKTKYKQINSLITKIENCEDGLVYATQDELNLLYSANRIISDFLLHGDK